VIEMKPGTVKKTDTGVETDQNGNDKPLVFVDAFLREITNGQNARP